MSEPEVRHPCPVCLGVKLETFRPVPGAELVLDRCGRCGGVWFDAGEVAHLRGLRPSAAWQKVALSEDDYRMPCHRCQALFDRNAERCPACGWKNVLDCPACGRAMERREVDGRQLDLCTGCRGVWFDRVELAAIWNLSVDALTRSRSAAALTTAGEVAVVGGDVVADFLLWNPDVAVFGARAVGHGLVHAGSFAAEAVAAAPEVLGTAVEATGELAGTVFEAIAEIIGALFD